MNIGEAIASAAKRLGDAGIAQPRREASSLMAYCVGRDAAFLIAHPEYDLAAVEAKRYEEAVARRAGREPFQLIVGKQEFYGLEFEVKAGVLIPRPETESLVEKAVEILGQRETSSFFEAGIGSGCISVAILHSVRTATATAVDISGRALKLAARNAERHGVSGRLNLLASDLFADENGRFDVIVSNPPYIPEGDADTLQPEVIRYDPHEALFSGSDGLNMIRRLITEAPDYLNARGYLLIEIGQDQAENVKRLLAADIWASVEVIPDLQGIPRTVVARLDM